MERPWLTAGTLCRSGEPEATRLLHIRLRGSPGPGYGSSLELLP